MNVSTGYGTYITAGILLVATLAHQFGWIDDATFQTIMGAAGAGGMTFLRAAQSKASSANAANAAVIATKVGVSPETIATTIKPPPAAQPASLV
jgi:hypothetical protein